MSVATSRPTPARPRRRSLLGLAAFSIVAGSIAVGAADRATAVTSDNDWLGIVNTYRATSGLDPVGANATWSAEAQAHSCYMLQNGITHDEIPGNPGYTPGGDIAGNSGNVAVSSSVDATPRGHIDLWMTGPFHAIGVLRHNLVTSGFGLCASSDTPTPWSSGGTLDVIRGIDHGRARPASPILFPGDGATIPLNRFITESPNPMSMCGWTGSAGLPLIAMMPADVTAANSTITGPNGPIATCTLHEGNVSDGTARAILDGENAVVVMPREILADGVYTATVTSNGGNATWSFTIDQDAALQAAAPEPPDTPDTKPSAAPAGFVPVEPFRLVDSREGRGTVRLQGGKMNRIEVAGADTVAVSANFVAVQPSGSGYITAYNCTTERPTVSTLNYQAGRVIANQAMVPLQGGDLCLYSHATTEIVIDVNGYYSTTTEGTGFMPVEPARLFDSREGKQVRAGKEVRVQITGVPGGPPAGTQAVALNVAAIHAKQNGWIRAYPCGAATADEISSINYAAGEVRPNSVVVPLDTNGRICLTSLRNVDVTVDMTGYFDDAAGAVFQPLDPIRLFDSRSPFDELNGTTGGKRVKAGQVVRLQVAGTRGIPADAEAASVNLAATSAKASTYLTAFPCGKRPTTSNVNISPFHSATANGAMVKLSDAGELCVYTLRDVHVIVDINGVWL